MGPRKESSKYEIRPSSLSISSHGTCSSPRTRARTRALDVSRVNLGREREKERERGRKEAPTRFPPHTQITRSDDEAEVAEGTDASRKY